MATTIGDILLDGDPYLLVPNGWQRMESVRTQPRATFRSAREFHRADGWNWWGMSDFYGMGVDNYVGDGPFLLGKGITLDTPGQFDVAKQLTKKVSETTANAGWIAFTVPAGPSGPRAIFAGKNVGKLWYSDDGGDTYTLVSNPWGVGIYATSWATGLTLTGGLVNYWVGDTNGHLWKTNDGNTWTDKGTPAGGTSLYVIGEFRGKLYCGHANGKLYTYDGTSFVEVFTGQLGTPITMGAVGNGYLHLLTAGPRMKLYITDATTLYNVQEVRTDFIGKSAVYLDTLWVFGNKTVSASGAGKGAIWRLGASGLEPVFEWGEDEQYAFGIETAVLDGDKIVWTARLYDDEPSSGSFNAPVSGTGIGVFDPGLDIFDDLTMGFYIAGTQSTSSGVPSGITRVGANLLYGIAGDGFYRETTPGPYVLISSTFDGLEPNVRHLWGQAVVKSSKLIAGQSVNFMTRRSSQGFDNEAWGATSGGAAGDDTHMFESPGGGTAYYTAEVQYVVWGDASDDPLTVFDVSMSFISVPETPKREWDLVVDCAGNARNPQRMRDGSANARGSIAQIADLNALWNTAVSFEDVDGTVYPAVIVKGPKENDEGMHRILTGAAVTDFRTRYRLHLTEL